MYCMKCGYVSNTYDPFNMLSVPIPQQAA
jgi:ubiquitin C-terminal hydrolase